MTCSNREGPWKLNSQKKNISELFLPRLNKTEFMVQCLFWLVLCQLDIWQEGISIKKMPPKDQAVGEMQSIFLISDL